MDVSTVQIPSRDECRRRNLRLNAVVRIIAPHNVISAPHVLFEETRIPDETINITYIVSMSTMWTAVRTNRTQVFTTESRSM